MKRAFDLNTMSLIGILLLVSTVFIPFVWPRPSGHNFPHIVISEEESQRLKSMGFELYPTILDEEKLILYALSDWGSLENIKEPDKLIVRLGYLGEKLALNKVADWLHRAQFGEKKILNGSGEGLFNLGDNDVPIIFKINNKIYGGFIDGWVACRFFYYPGLIDRSPIFSSFSDGNVYYSLEEPWWELQYFTLGKGVLAMFIGFFGIIMIALGVKQSVKSKE